MIVNLVHKIHCTYLAANLQLSTQMFHPIQAKNNNRLVHITHNIIQKSVHSFFWSLQALYSEPALMCCSLRIT